MSFDSGVYPVYDTIFKIGTKGLASTASDMKTIADMEEFGMKINGEVQKWTPMTTAGWARKLMTGKDFSISLKGKRNIGDAGNDYVSACAWADGLNCSTIAEIDLPNGDKISFNCVINVTNPGGSKSTDVAPLEFDLDGDGKPTYTVAESYSALEMSSISPTNGGTNVTLSSNITLTFNNAISSHNIFLVNDTDDTNVPAAITLDATKKIITIDPTSNLTASKKYAVIIAGVVDIYGQSLANTISYFTAAAA